MDEERIFKFLKRCNRQHATPDLHSFKANIKNGVAFVDCRGYETFIESITCNESGDETREQFTGTAAEVAERLYELQIDLNSIEM